MGNHENFEAQKTTDSSQESKISNLSSYMMERPAPAQSGRDKNESLVATGVLPSMDIFDFKSSAPEAKPAELKDSGVKVEHGKDGSTKVDYPSGVKVESTGITHTDKGKIQVETGGIVVEAVAPNHMNKKGEVIDPKGRIIAKPNEDGGITVDSGKGFYTQDADGTIHRESAIRSRDGKDFEVLDTSSPLGNLRPGDVVKQK